MDLEDIMQVKTHRKDKYCMISYVELRKTKLINTGNRLVKALDEEGKKKKNSSYKINKVLGF